MMKINCVDYQKPAGVWFPFARGCFDIFHLILHRGKFIKMYFICLLILEKSECTKWRSYMVTS